MGRSHIAKQVGRRLIAGVVAYVVVLQLLVPGYALARVADAAPDHSVICASDTNVADAPAQHPVDRHATCVCIACAMAGGDGTLGPTPASHAIVWQGIATTYHFARLADAGPPSRTSAAGPHNPRAPPTA